MLSMFNPWLILAALSFTGLFGWYEHHAGYIDAKTEMAFEVAKANEQSRQTEEVLSNKLTDKATQLRKVQKDADKKIEKLKRDVGNGVVRLSIPTKGCVQTSTDAPVASGDLGNARAELDGQTAQDLIAITEDGDKAIRKHAACVAAYNEVREQLNAKR